MKKLTLLLVLVMIGSAAFTQLDPFMPPNPITFAQGGAFTANAEGMNAFFYNPAGFRHDNGELTLTSVGVYSLIDRSLLELVMGVTGVASGVNRQSDLPIPEELGALVGDLEKIASWLDKVNDDGELETAINAAKTVLVDINPGLAEALDDPASLTEEEITLIILEADIFGDEDNDGTTNLTEIIEAMNGATTEDVLGGSYLDSGDFSTFDSNVEAASASVPGGEMRVGALAGVAYVGNGLGLGLFVGADGTFDGDTILNSKGRFVTSVTLAGGLAFPVGPFTIGAQVRPTILGYTDIYPAELLLSGDPSNLFTEAVYTGFYLGVDAGALFDLGPFTFGLAVKDLLPLPVQWSSYDGFEAYAAGLQGGSFFGPNEVSQEGLYRIPPMKVNVGAQFHPNLGPLNWIVDPRVNVDIHDVLGFLRYINQCRIPWKLTKPHWARVRYPGASAYWC
jgi:hypothetical protein